MNLFGKHTRTYIRHGQRILETLDIAVVDLAEGGNTCTRSCRAVSVFREREEISVGSNGETK